MRQVTPELVAELGELFGQLWSLLEGRYGSRELARMAVRIIGVVVDHGEEPVARALRATFQAGRQDLLGLPRWVPEGPREVPVPQALTGYEVQVSRAADYDALLLGGAR